MSVTGARHLKSWHCILAYAILGVMLVFAVTINLSSKTVDEDSLLDKAFAEFGGKQPSLEIETDKPQIRSANMVNLTQNVVF